MAKAERSLTALMEAAPQTAHVVNLPGVGRGSAADKGDSSDAVLHRGAPFLDGEAAASGVVRPAVAQSLGWMSPVQYRQSQGMAA